METKHLEAGTIKLQIHADKKAAGEAAARAAAEALQQLDHSENGIGVIFATGASQLETLRALTTIPGLPWGKVQGFHLDEYLGMDENHPASFRRYLRENLTRRVPMGDFFGYNLGKPVAFQSALFQVGKGAHSIAIFQCLLEREPKYY